ncbi:hypothetical protein HOLleu_30881 [Holothuria leucospilota]|uniref:Uncharacterized protein n=1 Tax=Holothuria leucospilota TaxID=206669 RepID=A0A9Q1BLA7_HOLLE|nr:hypothetical protein HOLleu_30881 [Holothuria leucospilota]
MDRPDCRITHCLIFLGTVLCNECIHVLCFSLCVMMFIGSCVVTPQLNISQGLCYGSVVFFQC